jgi:hypothetical protein
MPSSIPAFIGEAGIEVTAHKGQSCVTLGGAVRCPVHRLGEGGLACRRRGSSSDLGGIPQAVSHLPGHYYRRGSLVYSERRIPRCALEVEGFRHLTLDAPSTHGKTAPSTGETATGDTGLTTTGLTAGLATTGDTGLTAGLTAGDTG